MMQSENILKYVSESVKSTARIWTQNDLSEEMLFSCVLEFVWYCVRHQ